MSLICCKTKISMGGRKAVGIFTAFGVDFWQLWLRDSGVSISGLGKNVRKLLFFIQKDKMNIYALA